MAALSVINRNYSEFSREANDLADAFKRSLVIEGITNTLEMAVDQMVSVYRLNAKTDLVRSTLGSFS